MHALLATLLAQAMVTPEVDHTLYAGLELTAQSYPSGTAGGAQDLFVPLTALAGAAPDEDFTLEIGAELRLQPFGALGVRGRDWDEPSDFGQLLRALRIGRPGGPIQIALGRVDRYTLGAGHLIRGYGNRDNPDYHPAGGSLAAAIGPTRAEVFLSDLTARRLLAAEVALDFARAFGGGEDQYDRYWLSTSLAHDGGAAGGLSPPMTLVHVDGQAALHRSRELQIFALLGAGARLGGLVDLGALLGLSADARGGPLELGGKLEVRKQGGSFRQGFFAPGYELSRFVATGLSGPPIADERIPDGWSGYGELRAASGLVTASLAFEQFSWGRTDADGALTVRWFGDRALGSLRAGAVGLGQRARSWVQADLRYRFVPAVYGVVLGGTAFLPQPQPLARGVYVGAGMGLDLER